MTPTPEWLGMLAARGTAVLLPTLVVASLMPRRFLPLRSLALRAGLAGLVLVPLSAGLPRIPWAVWPAEVVPAAAVPAERGSAAAFDPPPVRPAPPPRVEVRDDSPGDVPTSGRSAGAGVPDVVARGEKAELPPADLMPPRRTTRPSPDTPPAAGQTATRPRWEWRPLIPVLYLMGVGVFSLRLFLGLRAVRRIDRSTRPLDDPAWSGDLEAARTRLDLRRPVRLRASAGVSTPLTYGALRPAIVVPEALAATTPETRRAVLLHELAHVARHDFAAVVLFEAVRAAYWFHPLAWLLGRSLRRTQEDLCDAACAAELGAGPYAEGLVAIARSLRPAPSVALGLAMARRSRLSRRIGEIRKHGGTTMTRLTPATTFVSAAGAAALLLLATLVEPVRAQRPDAPPASALEPTNAAATRPDAAAAAPETKVVPYPRVVLHLREPDGETPIAGARATLQPLTPAEDRFDHAGPAREAVSGADGAVAFHLPGLAGGDSDLAAELRVEGRASEFEWYPVERADRKRAPHAVRLRPGLTLTTRVLDAEGRPAADAHVLSVVVPADGGDAWQGFHAADGEGRVRFDIPRGGTFAVLVASERGAPHRAVLPAGAAFPAEIRLARGAAVTGRLLGRDGRPLPGREVVLEEEDSRAVETLYEIFPAEGALHPRFARRTDGEGRFRFPPMTGRVLVSLSTEGEPARHAEGLIPVALELPAAGERWLPLMLSPAGTVRGTVRWPDGRPAAGLWLQAAVPPASSEIDVRLASAETDAEGRYELRVPFPAEKVVLSGAGLRGPDKRHWRVRPADGAPGRRVYHRLEAERYVGDPLTVDWVMTPAEEAETPAPAAADPDWEPLAGLERGIAAALQASRAPDGRDERWRLDPRRTMTGPCLEFEERHRGTRLGVGALRYVMTAGASSLDRETAAARKRAARVIADHYVRHPDVDLLVGSLDAGAPVPDAEVLLGRLAAESPFDYVRAEAMLELARLHFGAVDLKEAVDGRHARTEAEWDALTATEPSEAARETLRARLDADRQWRDALAGVDPERKRREAVDLLDRVASRYAGVATPPRDWSSAAGLREPSAELKLTDRARRTTGLVRTAAERAAALSFQRTRLGIGRAAPDIEGLDLAGGRIRLSQFRGRVVLLTVSSGGPENALYAECGKLREALKGEPFECVSVVAASGGHSARRIAEEGGVTWPVVHDTAEGDVAHLWCQRSASEVYVIDRGGVIRSRLDGHVIGPIMLDEVRRAMAPGGGDAGFGGP